MRTSGLRRWFMLACGVLVMGSVVIMSRASEAGARGAERPNIIFIMSDDSGWGDVGWNGNQILDSPVLDQLREESVELTRFYVAPTCAPTRAALLTGRHPLRTGVLNTTRGHQVLAGSELTIAEALKAAGYTTGCFGKWHNGANHPWTAQGQGFDVFIGFNGGFLSNYFDSPLEFNGNVKPTKGFITDVLTDEALTFIKENRDGPFFAYVSYNVPHSPFQAPDNLYKKYSKLMDIEALRPGQERTQDIRTAAVYAMLENMDANIGRILDALKDSGLEKNTIVIYTTDNGPATARYNGVLRAGKGTVYEGGVLVPFVIRYPGVLDAGKVVTPLAMHVDMFPTLLEFAGIPLPEGLAIDGKSIVPLLKGTASDWPERKYFGIRNRGGENGEPVKLYPGCVISDQYKFLVHDGGKPRMELYDLLADPGEKHNLAEAKPELLEAMRSSYEEWFHEMTRERGAVVRIPPVKLGAGTELLVSEAHFRNGARYFGRGFDYDWAVGFENPDAEVYWPVEVTGGGAYRVHVMHTAKRVGRIEIKVGEESIRAAITEAYDPPYVPSPDYSERWEVYDKPFRPLLIGTINIPSGKGEVRVRGSEGVEIQTVKLERIKL